MAVQKYFISRDPVLYEAWPDVALTPEGKLIAVFNECTHHIDRSYTRIMLTESTDRGRTWSAKRPLTPAARKPECYYNCPRITLLRDGRLVIIFDRMEWGAGGEQTQTAEPRQTIAPQQAETAPAKPQPEAKLQQSNAKALWETVRRAIQIKNPTLAVLGMKCECQIEGDALFVRFPKRTIADAFMKPEMLKVAQDALSAAANGMSIRFGAAEMKNESVAETAKKAFGSMIEIVE